MEKNKFAKLSWWEIAPINHKNLKNWFIGAEICPYLCQLAGSHSSDPGYITQQDRLAMALDMQPASQPGAHLGGVRGKEADGEAGTPASRREGKQGIPEL